MCKVWWESILTLLHIVVLALVQGITEFLPISSSGHLDLVPEFTDWPRQPSVINVAVHVGTLGAVVIYVRRDLWEMTVGLGRALRGRGDAGADLLAFVVVGSLPIVAAGYAVHFYLGDALRRLDIIAWATLVFGVVLYLCDRLGMTVRRVEHMRLRDAVIIGCAQALALIPGTSRAGVTMSAARMLGLERTDAARFSMLLSIPAILGAGALKSLELYQAGDAALTAAAAIAAGLAFVAALLAIALMMAWLRRATFTPFVVYRVVLGAFLLALTYGVFA